MPLEVVYGEPRRRALALRLAEVLQSVSSDGTAYLGYPVLATADERVHVDVLLVSPSHGLVAFQISEEVPATKEAWRACVEDQDRLFSVLESHLGRHDQLRAGRRLALEVHTVTVFPEHVDPPVDVGDGEYCGLGEVSEVIGPFAGLEGDILVALQAALQRVTTIKPSKKRTNVLVAGSRGAILKEVERGIANLDRWQKQAAIETPEGPQRIRGLAGSGKTIVLALKAAYLHTQHPEWNVVVAFQTRALYQQFEDLVTRFTFEHSNDRPDFDHLRILHAWGASGREGVYKTLARHLGAPFRDWNYALQTHGRDDAFAGICRELLELAAERDDLEPIFDAVLIDEAQDLPAEFFRLVYRFTRDPKRVVWAFDELQNLGEAAMPTTDELFGRDQAGASVVSLDSSPGEARRDVVLPICYRNSPWALATAHALGFGIYRDGGLVQHFDELHLWEDIGYRVVSGSLTAGRRVEMERSPTSSPDYFPKLLTPSDAVRLKSFDSEAEQDAWVAKQIVKNLSEDELEYDDILVVLPDAYTSKRRAARFGRILATRGIESHLVGVGSSVDEVFVGGSVAVAHIHRAKGNEAPMVYLLDAQYGAGAASLISRRNTLFTGITRSRGWVRITGWGPHMVEIADEVEEVRRHDFRLDFKVPTAPERAKLRRIHRERSASEVEEIERHSRSLAEALEALERGDLEFQDLPPRLRTRLMLALESESGDGDNDSDSY